MQDKAREYVAKYIGFFGADDSELIRAIQNIENIPASIIRDAIREYRS